MRYNEYLTEGLKYCVNVDTPYEKGDRVFVLDEIETAEHLIEIRDLISQKVIYQTYNTDTMEVTCKLGIFDNTLNCFLPTRYIIKINHELISLLITIIKEGN